MVVSTNYNLIPYPNHNYQVLPYVQENRLVPREHGQVSIERHKLLGWPHSDIKTGDIHFEFHSNGYDAKHCLQYSDADQIGLLVDVYA